MMNSRATHDGFHRIPSQIFREFCRQPFSDQSDSKCPSGSIGFAHLPTGPKERPSQQLPHPLRSGFASIRSPQTFSYCTAIFWRSAPPKRRAAFLLGKRKPRIASGAVCLDAGKYEQMGLPTQENREIRSSGGGGDDSVRSTVARWYDFREPGGYLGNVG